MTISNITKTQQKQLKSVVFQWIKDNFEDYFNEVSSDFVKLFEGVDFKEFSERMSELILNGFEKSTPTLLSSDYFYTNEAYSVASQYLDEIEEKETDELLNFDEDKDIFGRDYYHDDDYYLETLNTIFKTDNISKHFKNSYSDVYVLIKDDEVHINIDDEKQYYDNFAELIEDLEGNLLYNVDKEMLLMAYFKEFQSEVFKWFSDSTEDYKEVRKLITQIEAEIPKTLKKRAKGITDEIKKQRADLKVFKQITDETINRKQQQIKANIDERKAIMEAQK